MSTETSSPVFLVDAYSEPVCLKIKGRASYLNCGQLNDFFNRLIKKDKTNFTVDFEECAGMDSTFLGLLAGVALELKKDSHKGTICLNNVKNRNLELITNLGLNRILEVNPETHTPKPTINNSNHTMKSMDKSSPVSPEAILKAHQNLISADSSNLYKFQDVMSFLKKEIDQESENVSK